MAKAAWKNPAPHQYSCVRAGHQLWALKQPGSAKFNVFVDGELIAEATSPDRAKAKAIAFADAAPPRPVIPAAVAGLAKGAGGRRSLPAKVVGPHPVDLHVGKQLRQRRVLMGLSQDALAGPIGLSFQQLQKYEKGGNRISAGRLYDLSKLLGVPVQYFFDGLEGPATDAAADLDGMRSRETLELVRDYHRIHEAAVRKCLLELMRSLGDMERRAGADPEATG